MENRFSSNYFIAKKFEPAFYICANKSHNVLVLALKSCDVGAFSDVSVFVDLFFIENLEK